MSIEPEVSGLSVLHVFSYYRPDFTGEGIYLGKLMGRLRQRRIDGDVVAVWSRGAAAEVSDGADRIWYFGRGDRRPRATNLPLVWWLLRNLHRYDVVHFHAWVDRHLLFHLLAKLLGRPVVHSCTLDDSIGNFVATYRPLYRPLVRRLVRLIDTLVAISPRLRDDSVALLPPGRTELVPQGVELPAPDEGAGRAEIRRRWGIAPEEVVLLFVGGLCERKDVRFLIERQIHVLARHPRARLLVVGPDLENDYAAALRERAAALGPGRVQFTGFMPDPEAAYRAADVFVFASRNEGFGNVLVEAMAYGLPVVCRRLPGVTDAIIDDGGTGHLFDDEAQYLAQVSALIGDPVRRTAMGRRARDAVQRRFGLEAAAARYEHIYRRLARPATEGAALP